MKRERGERKNLVDSVLVNKMYCRFFSIMFKLLVVYGRVFQAYGARERGTERVTTQKPLFHIIDWCPFRLPRIQVAYYSLCFISSSQFLLIFFFYNDLAGPRNQEINSSSSHQFQSNYSPQQQIFHARPPYHSFTPSRTPVRMKSPFPAHQGNESYGSPHYYNTPTNTSRGGNVCSPRFQPAGSPSFSHGRGRGQRGGRGIGSHGQVSARDRPELFYNKSMVEDPWKFLKPVIWSRQDVKLKSMDDNNNITTPGSLKSIGMKKARVTEGNIGSSSQPSLAEYLAASLNEAVSDGPG